MYVDWKRWIWNDTAAAESKGDTLSLLLAFSLSTLQIWHTHTHTHTNTHTYTHTHTHTHTLSIHHLHSCCRVSEHIATGCMLNAMVLCCISLRHDNMWHIYTHTYAFIYIHIYTYHYIHMCVYILVHARHVTHSRKCWMRWRSAALRCVATTCYICTHIYLYVYT